MRGRPAPVPAIRAGDADRERAADVVGRACAEGRLTLAELEDRAARAYRAETIEELDRLVADLPADPPREPGPAVAARQWIVGTFGRTERGGRWQLAARTVAVSVFGVTTIDLRRAVIEGDAVTVRTVGVMGSVDVIVPPGVPVTVGGRGVLGSVGRYGLSHDRPAPGVPHVHIDAIAVLGSVKVRRVRPPREPRLRAGRRVGSRSGAT